MRKKHFMSGPGSRGVLHFSTRMEQHGLAPGMHAAQAVLKRTIREARTQFVDRASVCPLIRGGRRTFLARHKFLAHTP